MAENGNGNGNGGGLTIKLSKWQATIVSTALAAGIIAGAASLLSFRDWKVRTEEKLSQIQLSTSLPRSEWLIEKEHIYLELEQIRIRVVASEDRERQRDRQ